MSESLTSGNSQDQHASAAISGNGADAEAEARYQAIFEQSVDSIVVVDLAGRMVDFNTAAHENLGFARDEFATMAIDDFEAAESPAEVRQHMTRILRDGHGRFETRHRTKSGEIRDVLVTSQAVSAGGKQYFVSMWRDITEQRLTHQAIEQKNAALHELLEQIHQAKDDVGRQVSDNLEKVILPMLDELAAELPPGSQARLDAIKSALEEIASPFATRLSGGVEGLSPAELRICRLVRSGISTKEIAHLEHLSPATVSKHRENIRRKLGIQGKKTNLVSHLDHLLDDNSLS